MEIADNIIDLNVNQLYFVFLLDNQKTVIIYLNKQQDNDRLKKIKILRKK